MGVYTRLSRDRDKDAASPERQARACRELVKRRGWTVAAVYEDRDLSGYSGRKRPGFEALMADLKAGRIDGFVAWKLDRLTRNRPDYLRVVEAVEAGVPFATVEDGIDPTTTNGIFIMDLLASFARGESLTLSVRARAAIDEKARRGDPHPNGGRPFGYDEKHRIVEREAAAVRRAAEVVLAGGTLGSVVRELNAEGITTARGNTFTSAQLGAVLRRPTIAGLRMHRGALYPGSWEPILDRETWQRLTATLNRNTPKGGGRRANLLTGLARCSDCSAEAGMTVQRNGKGVRRYVCSATAGGCGKRGILADGLDQHVTDHVLTALDGPGLRRMLGRRKGDKRQSSTQADLDAAQADLDQLTHDHHVLRVVPRKAYLDTARALNERIAQLTAELAVDTNSAVLSNLPTADLRGWWGRADLHARRSVLDAVLSEVVVGPVRRGGAGWDPERVNLVWRA